MLEKSQLIQALKSGDADTLSASSHSGVDQDVLADEEVQVALARAADCVVFHRPNYHQAVKQAVELGIPCDIWTAARAGLDDQVKRLLADNPDLLNAKDNVGRTVLQRASLIYGVSQECKAVADYLIAMGATVDIFTASTFCVPDIVHQQLQRNPDLISARCQGSTPLNWAVRPRENSSKAPQICRALLDAGADVNDRDEDEAGMTPLHHAAEWGPPICLILVDMLLDAGADINRTDEQNWTPLDYARDRKRTEMVNHLTAHGAIGRA